MEEYWSYPQLLGYCEDYVLEKHRRLLKTGVEAGNLLITVVRQTNGDGHAVLTLVTDRGDLILDNLNNHVLPWAQTNYEFLKRQSSKHAGHWLAINDGRAIALGSATSMR